jgi:hypothetical protein
MSTFTKKVGTGIQYPPRKAVATEPLRTLIAEAVSRPWSNAHAAYDEAMSYGRQHRARNTPATCMLIELRALCRATMLPRFAGPDRVWATAVLEQIVHTTMRGYYDDTITRAASLA